MILYQFTRISGNRKTGLIPTTMTEAASCPSVCPLKGNGCYAEGYPLVIHWKKRCTLSIEELCERIAALPNGQLWRHNVAGDLVHSLRSNYLDNVPTTTHERINFFHLESIIKANQGKRGFTYTHHDVTAGTNHSMVNFANKNGFAINLSANNYAHADQLKALDCGPVVTVQSMHADKIEYTPAGHKVVTCPATYLDDVTCETCQLCQHVSRETIVGFPAHGARKTKAETASINFVPKTW